MGSLFSIDAATGNLTTAGSITSTSISSGFLLPRLTTTQRNAISSPATGLEIFNLTTNQVEFYNGTVWGAVGGGSGTVNPGTLDQLAYYSVSGSTLSGSSTLSQDSSGLILGGTNIGIRNTGAYGISSNSLLSLSGTPFVQVNSDLAIVSTHNIILHDDSNSINTISLKGPTSNVTASYTLRMPTSQGGANTFLQNDGSGNLSWGTGSGVTGSGTISQITKWTSGSTIGNSALADNGPGNTSSAGLFYSNPTSGQLSPYFTYSDSTTLEEAQESFTGHTGTFSSATNMLTMPQYNGGLVVIHGWELSAFARTFTDMILMTAHTSAIPAVFTVVSSVQTGSPAPVARSYTISQRTLFMQMSGNSISYNVGCKVTNIE